MPRYICQRCEQLMLYFPVGMARQLDPDLDLIVKATPYLLRSFLNSKHKAVRQNLKTSDRRPNIYEDAYMYLFT